MPVLLCDDSSDDDMPSVVPPPAAKKKKNVWVQVINEDGGSTEFSEAQRDAMLLKLFAPERSQRAQMYTTESGEDNSTRALFL